MRSLRLASGVALSAVVGWTVVAGCGGDPFSGSTSADGGPDVVAVDGLVPDGPGGGEGGGDAGGDATTGDASTGKVVYVSNATGDDLRTGLDSAHPKKTIASALSEASLLGAGTEVHVCAGNYAESNLTLKNDVALLGAYDCVGWKRTAGYGWPTFDGKNQSVVTNAMPALQAATLVVTDASVTSKTVIDGLSIVGAPTASGATLGVDVEGAASPALTNDVISGGGGKITSSSSGWGSVGVRIGGTSSAQLSSSVISGGSGEAAGGSVGVLLTSSGVPDVHGNVISGGTGVSTGATPDLGAVGVVILSSLDATKPLRDLLVSGTDMAGTPGTSVGVLVQGNGVNAGVVGCSVTGGTGTDTTTASVGIDIETTGNVNIVDDRIFGGTRSGATSQTFGVRGGASVSSLTIANSEIHAGAPSGGSSSSAVGIGLTAGTSISIAENTIYTGSTSGSMAIQLGNGVKGATLTGNVLLGGGAASSDIAIVAGVCAGSFAVIDRTAFANFPLLFQCNTTTLATDPSVLATLLGSSVKTDGNVELQACTGQLWCVQDSACPSTPAGSCVQSVLGSSWSSMDDGVSGLFAGALPADGGVPFGAWELKPGIPCAVAHGGTALGSLPTDLLGAQRGAMPSMGAVQYSVAVACQ